MTHPPRRASTLASAAFIACLGLWSAPLVASHVGEDVTLDQEMVGSNDQLLGAVAQWEKMPASVRDARVAQLTALAERRQERLIELLEKNPKVAASRMMPKALRDRLPPPVAALVEREVSAQGTVFASVADNFEQGVSRTEFKFQPDAGGLPLRLYLADGSDDQDLMKWAGKKLSLNAMRIGERLALLDKAQARLMAADGTTTSTGTVVTSPTPVQGVQKTLSILVNFNDQALTCTAADVSNRLFGSTGATVNNNYRESSRGLVSFTGQAVGPFTINYSSTGSCDYSGWGAAAEAAARAAGIDPSQYTRVNYVTPRNATCGWSGLAYMPGRQSWVASCGSTGLFSHELGHNLKLHHAATPTSEYGDSSDPMGNTRLVGHNGANRAMAGWMPTGTVVDAGAAGTYSLTTLSNTTSVGTPQVLRLFKADTKEYYYVSLRQAMGFDATLATNFIGTLSVHRATGTLPAKTFLLQVLAAGQSFVDAGNGITITNQGVANGVATVAVAATGTAAVCTRSAPTLAVSPASQTASPGVARSFTVTVTNKNSSACGSSTFALSQVLPGGFSGSFSSSSLALGAGASGSVTWTAASGSTALPATYTLDATAADSASSTSRTTSHASYIIYAADATAPSLSITSPTATTVSARTNLSIAASASDASGIQAVEFYADGKLLARDTSAPYTATWNLRKAGKGGHTIKARAIDNAGNAAEKSVTITVN